MDALLRTLGRTAGTVDERIARLEKDQAYPLTEEGRTRIMADAEATPEMKAKAETRLRELNAKPPRGTGGRLTIDPARTRRSSATFTTSYERQRVRPC